MRLIVIFSRPGEGMWTKLAFLFLVLVDLVVPFAMLGPRKLLLTSWPVTGEIRSWVEPDVGRYVVVNATEAIGTLTRKPDFLGLLRFNLKFETEVGKGFVFVSLY